MLKDEEPGKPGDSAEGSAEGCGIRGNSMNHRRKSRKMQDSGRPEDCIERRGRRVEDAGKPVDLQPAAPKDAELEETRRTHRRHSLKMQEAGKLAASWQG
jgi:hypothetical protein